jgi:hypothetical protein
MMGNDSQEGLVIPAQAGIQILDIGFSNLDII